MSQAKGTAFTKALGKQSLFSRSVWWSRISERNWDGARSCGHVVSQGHVAALLGRLSRIAEVLQPSVGGGQGLTSIWIDRDLAVWRKVL